MKKPLIKHLEGKQVKVWIDGKPAPIEGKLLVVEDTGIVLSNRKHGTSVIDCRFIKSISEVKECEELENDTQQ